MDGNQGWGLFRQAAIGKPLGNGLVVSRGSLFSAVQAEEKVFAVENRIRLAGGFVESQLGCAPAFTAGRRRFRC